MTTDQRIEFDALGDIKVAGDALYGAQTARAAAWSFSGQRFPLPVIHAIAHFKAASASVRGARRELSPDKARAIEQAALEVADGQHDDHFPLEVFQTGSATSANMNVNEVVANRAALLLGASLPSQLVHPNDDVNAGQSSNDVVPSAVHLALLQAAGSRLRPALDRVIARFHELAESHWQDIRNGKTHLMRATPLRMGQQFRGYSHQLEQHRERLTHALDGCRELPLGGTAVGTGIGCSPGLATSICETVSSRCRTRVFETSTHLGRQGNLDAVTAFVASINTTCTTLYKLANDLRWQSTEALGEIELPVMQPGSSIMPGKTNPVVLEAVLMACQQIEGHALVVSRANSQGQFELHTMIPLVAMNALSAVDLLASALDALCRYCLQGLKVGKSVSADVGRNPILVTALVSHIGHERAAELAARAVAEGVSVLAVARRDTDLDAATLARLLDPSRLAGESGSQGPTDDAAQPGDN